MTTAAQLFALFAFGLVITGIVLLGLLRAKETAERGAQASAANGSGQELQ